MKEFIFMFFVICWVISVAAWIACLIYSIRTHKIIPTVVSVLCVQFFNIALLITGKLF